MTQDDIIRMAREAGAEFYAETICVNGKDAHDFIERFAALVAAHEREKHLNLANEVAWSVALAEREACAKVCIDQLLSNPTTNPFDAGFNVGTGNCAAAIRARGE